MNKKRLPTKAMKTLGRRADIQHLALFLFLVSGTNSFSKLPTFHSQTVVQHAKTDDMKTEVAIKVLYKESGFGASTLDRNDFNELKEKLRQDYVAQFKDTRGPQAGGILDTIVEIFTNISITDIAQIIRDGLIFDLLTRREESIVLKPLIKAFQDIEAKAESWDYTKVRFAFDDSEVVIYGASNLFTSTVGRVFPEVLEHYDNMVHKDFGAPCGIHIPVQQWSDEKGDWHTPDGSGEDYDIDEYLKFWGLEYHMGHERCIYDVHAKTIIDDTWK